jgi:DNA ligase-1
VRRFAALVDALDCTTSTNAKVAAMRAYFEQAPPEDAAWGLFFLMGRRFKRTLPARPLWVWAREVSGLPQWLIDQCYTLVGDRAETLTLLLDSRGEDAPGPLHVVVEQIRELRDLPEPEQEAVVRRWWATHSGRHLFVLNKLLTGSFRIGVSQKLVTRALAEVAELPPATLAHRVMGEWEPGPDFLKAVLSPETGEADLSQPYPFFLASTLGKEPGELGDIGAWRLEWKWDGIRGQLIRRGGECVLWSRGEEMVTGQFPEIVQCAARLPAGLVLDGEVLAWRDGAALPFSALQRRLGRKSLTRGVLVEAPAAFMAYDLLEYEGRDIRERPLRERLGLLREILAGAGGPLLLSGALEAADWEAAEALRVRAREVRAEGLMIKGLDSPYRAGRVRGDWWKWKVDPLSVDAVLLYAEAGHGRRANLFTDYTFGVWEAGELVPFTKAYSGLTDGEIATLDRWIRQNTLEKFGPVRVVPPEHVFELHFEGIAASQRHRGGVALRFPRIARWRTDKPPAEADTLEGLRGLIDEEPTLRQAELDLE